MKTLLILIAAISIYFTPHNPENKITGFIYDVNTGQGIHSANIYWKNAPTNGTVTNEDGFFSLISNKNCDTIVVSCLGFKTTQYKVDSKKRNSIGLIEHSYEIAELVVKPLNANEIMSKVISNLQQNHPFSSVYYNFYSREVHYSNDSTIYFIEDHFGIIEHKELGIKRFSNNVAIKESRIGYFTDKGKEKVANARFIGLSQILWDNPVFDRIEFLKKKHLKHFRFTYLGRALIGEKDCLIIKFETDKSFLFPKGTLYIDNESHAIVKEVMQNSKKTELKEVNFIESNGRWYLSSVYYYTSRLSGLSYRATLYNANFSNELNNNFTTIGSLLPTFVKDKATKFDIIDHDNINSIILPSWITQRIAK